MPQNGLTMFSINNQVNSPPTENAEYANTSIDKKSQRHSMGVAFKGVFEQPAAPARSLTASRPQSLQSSYSTNDLPTVKSSNGFNANATPPKTHAEQHFHNHNASLGRFPAGAVSNRQSRDLSSLAQSDSRREEKQAVSQAPMQGGQHATANNASALQASAPSFGPTVPANPAVNNGATSYGQGNGTYNNGQYYQYAIQQYTGMPNGFNQAVPFIPNGSHFGTYPTYGGANRPLDVVKPIAGRRTEEGVRYNNAPLNQFVGDIYNVCKDQHGCRYLQRKLEEKNAENTQAIFAETCPHIAELMTGKEFPQSNPHRH